MFDKAWSIVVNTNKIIGSFYHFFLLISESWKSVSSNQFSHLGRVISKVKRVVIPSEIELERSINCFNVILILWIIRKSKATISIHSNFSLLLSLILLSVSLNSLSVSQNSVMGCNVWFSGSISTSTNSCTLFSHVWAASARCMPSSSISIPGKGMGFIEGDPVFDSASESFKAEISIVIECINDIWIEPSILVI